MLNFFKLTRSRVILTFILVLYVYLSLYVFSIFNTGRSIDPVITTAIDNIAISFSLFGVLLNIPFFYVGSFVNWWLGLIVEVLFLYSIAPSIIHFRNYVAMKIKLMRKR